jgi:predicted acetyltransferase
MSFGGFTLRVLTMDLVWAAEAFLPSYVAALRQGWSPDTQRADAAHDELARIAQNPVQFVASLVDREGRGPAIVLPDGSSVPRLPGYTRWLWDGEFCGAINVRWQPGTTALPPTCLGHVGYSVVPWKRRRGYATRALALLLPELVALELPFVELTTDAANVASQRVIESNGGVFVEVFRKPASHGDTLGKRFRIALQQG